MSISDDELAAFMGLNESYIEMDSKSPPAPKCHMKYMSFEVGEDDSWWECSYCGHTKEIN